MIITVEIPEGLASQLISAGRDPARTVLEAMALEGYRSDRLTETEIRELLGFDSRLDVHRFLKEHGAFLPYTDDDLAHDRDIASQVARRARMESQEGRPDQRRAG
jgi:hypothetical protein